MKSVSLSVVCALILGGVVWSACETSEDDKINQAQVCLDKASDGTSANVCVAKVDGITGPRAAMIRCAAVWIGQGFTTNSTKFLDAFHALKNDTSGNNKTVAMMQYLAFDTDANADLAVNYCTQTGIESWIMFANMAKLATSLKTLSGNPNPTATDLQNQVANLSDAEAGQAAQAIADNYCRNSSTHDEAFCGQFNAATQNSNLTDAEKGCLLKQQLGGNNTCP